jgi:putative membrane protein
MDKTKTFFKGVLMGTCDVVPGISGGTIAFVTGIYFRLIEAVKSFSPRVLLDSGKYFLKRDKKRFDLLKEDVKKMEIPFLLTLGAGIGVAILIISHLVTFLLETYFVFTMSFFSGLILASSLVIFNNIRNHKFVNILFGVFGILFGVLLLFVSPLEVSSPSYFYVFLGGFIGVSAMFLPGISGAFILVVMGLYGFVLDLVKDIFGNFSYLAVFGVGLVAGVLVISRVVSYLFRKDKCKTLYFLLGLVLGALSIPIRDIRGSFVFGVEEIVLVSFFFLVGVLVVLGVEGHSRRKREAWLAKGYGA